MFPVRDLFKEINIRNIDYQCYINTTWLNELDGSRFAIVNNCENIDNANITQ